MGAWQQPIAERNDLSRRSARLLRDQALRKQDCWGEHGHRLAAAGSGFEVAHRGAEGEPVTIGEGHHGAVLMDNTAPEQGTRQTP